MSEAVAERNTQAVLAARPGRPVGRAGWQEGAVLGGLAALAHLPLLAVLARRLWATDHYQFFPLVLIGGAIIVWMRLKEQPPDWSAGRAAWRWILWSLSLLLLSTAVLLHTPWLAGLSALSTLWAVGYSLGGRPLLARLWPAWAFLWIALPLPLGLDRQLIDGLQRIATLWASGVLDLAGLRHLPAGNVIELPAKSYLVEEACSGINSLFSALGCTLFYLIMVRRHAFRILLIVAAVFFWVLVANATRVTLATALDDRWGLPVTEGLGHEALGLMVFVVSMGMIVSTDRLLLFLRSPSTPGGRGRQGFWGRLLRRKKYSGKKNARYASRTATRKKRKEVVAAGQRPVDSGAERAAVRSRVSLADRPQPLPRREVVAIGTVLVLLVAAQTTLWAFSTGDNSTVATGGGATIKPLGQEDLPRSWNGWQQTSFETVERTAGDPNGRHSRIWRYEKGGQTAIVSLDGLFTGWHRLGNCVEGQGWTADGRAIHAYRDAGQELDGGFMEMDFRKGVQQQAYVVYGIFDQQNRPLEPLDTYTRLSSVERFPKLAQLYSRIGHWSNPDQPGPGSLTYQVQVFAESYVPLDAEQRKDIRELFHFVGDEIRGR